MVYLDTNIFVYYILDSELRGEKAKSLLRTIVGGEEAAITSSLTIDEVVWILWKETKNREFAVSEALKLFEMPNLEIVSVTPEMSLKSLLLMQKYPKLKPRDAIHAAVCLLSGVFRIASDDPDFDDIKELERVKL